MKVQSHGKTVFDIVLLLTLSGNLQKHVNSVQMVNASKLLTIMCQCVYLRLAIQGPEIYIGEILNGILVLEIWSSDVR